MNLRYGRNSGQIKGLVASETGQEFFGEAFGFSRCINAQVTGLPFRNELILAHDLITKGDDSLVQGF